MAAPHINTSDMSDLVSLKKATRQQALQRRPTTDPAHGEALAEHVILSSPPPSGAIIGGFWPLPGEIDLRPLLARLAVAGHVLALPVTPPRGWPLTFRRWAPGEKLVSGRFGTLHPEGPELAPDFYLVPLLAFDRAGRRLGYGGGYYDRTLAPCLDVPRLGIALAAQELPVVPAGPHDIRLPKIATEQGIIECEETRE